MEDWNKKATRTLKIEIARHDMTYHELAERLANMGVKESASAISNKINRGSFSFVFFLQCMSALGVKAVQLDNL